MQVAINRTSDVWLTSHNFISGPLENAPVTSSLGILNLSVQSSQNVGLSAVRHCKLKYTSTRRASVGLDSYCLCTKRFCGCLISFVISLDLQTTPTDRKIKEVTRHALYPHDTTWPLIISARWDDYSASHRRSTFVMQLGSLIQYWLVDSY